MKKNGQSVAAKGGIYLDELNHDEPELTALYLYSRKTYAVWFHYKFYFTVLSTGSAVVGAFVLYTG